LATRPNFRPEKPGFYNLRHINDYVARISYLSRLGYAEGDTVLYYPSDDYYGNPKICENACESFKNAGMELEKRCVAFDIIDDFGILEATDTGDGLKLGDAIYKNVVVPDCKYMPREVKEKIAPYIGVGTPTYSFKNPNLRVMTRRLDNGRLWFIFNEGEGSVTESFKIADGKAVYKFDLENGEMLRDDTATATILTGEIAVFLVTNEEYPTVSDKREHVCEMKDFEPISYKKFIIGYDNLYNEYGAGAPEIDEHFSGEITYKASYELPKNPCADDKYVIRLEGFSLTASIEIGGEKFTFGLSPMERMIDGAPLDGRGELTVTVANTSVGEIKRTEKLMEGIPRAERGPYLDRIKVFEERVPKLKVGKIIIEKIV
jgi:hypothetical protein